jgi:hypothetical protein
MAAQRDEAADDRHGHHEKTDNNQHIRPLPTKSKTGVNDPLFPPTQKGGLRGVFQGF